MKLFVSIVMAGLLVFQTFNRAYFVIYYEINKEYIAKYLCENKDEPMSTCNGRCFLRDQLEKSSDTDGENENTVIPTWNQTEYDTPELLVFEPYNNDILKSTGRYKNRLYGGCYSSIFKPPA